MPPRAPLSPWSPQGRPASPKPRLPQPGLTLQHEAQGSPGGRSSFPLIPAGPRGLSHPRPRPRPQAVPGPSFGSGVPGAQGSKSGIHWPQVSSPREPTASPDLKGRRRGKNPGVGGGDTYPDTSSKIHPVQEKHKSVTNGTSVFPCFLLWLGLKIRKC